MASPGKNMQAFVDQWPEAFREAFGLAAYTTGTGCLNVEVFSLMIPLVLIAVTLGVAAAATAGEEERGTADLVFALPVTRSRIQLAQVLALVLTVAIVALATTVVILVGAPLVDLEVSAGGVVAGMAMNSLLAMTFGGFGFVLGAWTGRRAAAIGAWLGLALASFLLNVLAPMAEWLEPWHRSRLLLGAGQQPAGKRDGWPMAGLLTAITVALIALAHMLLQRRDLSSRSSIVKPGRLSAHCSRRSRLLVPLERLRYRGSKFQVIRT